MTAKLDTWPAAPALEAPRIEWVRFYIETLGWRVVPAAPGTNETSLVKWGEHRETPHGDLLRAWEGWLKQWPDANVALITGAPSGVIGVDIDTHKGGRASLESSGLPVPATLMDATPGGFHAYYEQPAGASTRSLTDVLPGVDIKGDGGNLVLPPSYRCDAKYPQGALYRWIDKRWIVPAVAPGWVLNPTPLVKRKERVAALVSDSDHPDWVATLLGAGVTEGDRNASSTRLAGYFLGKSLPTDIVLAIMREFGTRCEPPMDDGELLGVIHSVKATKQRAKLAGIERPPVEVNIGSGWRYEFEDERVQVQFRDVDRRGDGIQAELTVLHTLGDAPKKLLGPVNFNLMSAQTQAAHAKLLGAKYAGTNWYDIIQHACDMGITAYRSGDPAVMLGIDEPPRDSQWALRRFVLANNVTLLYADSGLGKSLMALAVALSIGLGEDVGLGMEPEIHRRVLYLDTEWTREDHDRRVFPLIGKRDGGANVLYRQLNTSLHDAKSSVAELVRTQSVGYIVVDSAAGACGGKPEESEATLQFFQALRQIGVGAGVGCFVVAHVTNEAARKDRVPDRPFGSAFWRAGSRMMWYLTKAQDTGAHSMDVALVNTKTNGGMPQRTTSYHIDFGDEEGRGLSIANQDVRQIAALAEKVLKLRERIPQALRRGPLTIAEMREVLTSDEGTTPSEAAVRKELSRGMKDDPARYVRMDGGGKVGEVVRYALAALPETGHG